MWIIPKTLQWSSGALDTEAFISDLNEQSQACALSLMVRSKPSPARTWLQKWRRDSWTQHLSGRILKPSHAKLFEIAWTSLWQVILVSPSAQQGSDLEPKTPATSGPTSHEQFELFAPVSASSRMSKDTSASDSEKSLENWNQSVTKRRGEYSQRLKLARRTSGSGSLSWPTMGTTQAHISGQGSSTVEEVARQKTFHLKQRTNKHGEVVTRGDGKTHQATLASAVVGVQNWPTANARDWKDSITGTHPPSRPRMSEQTLGQAVSVIHGQAAPANPSTDGSRQGLWRIPSSSDGEGGVMEMREGCAGKYKLRDHAANGNKSAKLNPRWVETLQGVCMGWTSPSCPASVIKNWPKFVSGWCALTIALTSFDSSATESCLPQPRELFEC
jgi:hypothetical protein